MRSLIYKFFMILSAATSLVAALVIFLRGPVLPQSLTAQQQTALYSSTRYFYLSLILIFCFLIPLSAFICLYDKINKKNFSIIGFLGLFFSITGTSLALLVSSVMTFVFPVLTSYPIDLHKETTSLLMSISIKIGLPSGLLYTLGIIFLSIKLFAFGKKSILPSILFLVHGILLSFGFSNIYLLITGWLFLSISLFIYSLILKNSISINE